MRVAIRKLRVEDVEKLQALVVENFDAIEPGLTVLDARLLLGHATIDVIGVDAAGALVLGNVGFSANEEISSEAYFPTIKPTGSASVQVAWSGPDQDIKTIREVYFAAIMRACHRVWLATPYFVPDAGLYDAICLAARLGRDVRVLCPFRPDKWLPHLAGRYTWMELLRAGGKVYQYTNGFMHAKVLMIDDVWSSVGSPNFDNRSLHLNFEATCLIESKDVQAELERGFLRDLEQSIRLDPKVYAGRPYVAKMMENACRLLSPVL